MGKGELSKRNEGKKRRSLIELGLGETIGGDSRLAEFGRRVAFQWVDDRQQRSGKNLEARGGPKSRVERGSGA